MPKPPELPAETRLDTDLTRPSTTAPGDGAYDTTDDRERASSSRPTPGPAAIARGTVNAVVPAGRTPEPRTEWLPTDRLERYVADGPSGERIPMVRNIETGESRRDQES